MARPNIAVFRVVAARKGGNISAIADHFGVLRHAVHDWVNADPKFKQVIEDARGRLFDRCLDTARNVALGIADIKEEDGKKHVVGWIERPDSNMLRYLMGTLGRKEGFGESIDVTSGGEKISPARVLSMKEVKEMLNDLEREN